MAPSMFRFFAAGGLMLVFVLLVLLNPQPTNSLDISVFPHYQTFDSWDNCSYVGTCYELYCNSLKGGWANPEYHDDVPPYTQAVRSWWVNSGPTTSNLDSNQNPLPCNKITTGPCYDHTSGSGKYLYAESSACFGYYFHATTPTFIFTAANASISFYYYMNGADLTVTNKNAHLRLKMSLSNGTNWMTIMDVSGRQQTNATQEWSHFETTLDSYFSYVPSPTSPVVADFMFEALTGGDDSGTYWKSDIAIDDVYWTQAGAPNTTDPYIDVTNTNTGGGTVGEGSGDGISDGEIAGIVVGVAGGLGALCCCLLLLLLLLLLAISPRGPKKGAAPAEAAEGDAGL